LKYFNGNKRIIQIIEEIMQQQTGINICERCSYFGQSVINRMQEMINYVMCIKQKVDEEDPDEEDPDEYQYDDYDDMPGPYDDLNDAQWSNISYDGYDGYDN